jgi:hypothetical protein
LDWLLFDDEGDAAAANAALPAAADAVRSGNGGFVGLAAVLPAAFGVRG